MEYRYAHFIKYAVLLLLCAVLFSMPVNGIALGPEIFCSAEDFSVYPEVVKHILPDRLVHISEVNKVYERLMKGGIAEAFDVQAIGAIENGIAGYWYPHYLATAVIAIDRSRTGVQIDGWMDLEGAAEDVAFISTRFNDIALLNAISFGLEGDEFTYGRASELLRNIYRDGRLVFDSFEPPIIICYDYQAAQMIKEGRDMEIIVPKEGTFTYEKGLLSPVPLDHLNYSDEFLVEAGLRTVSGMANPELYPELDEYSVAKKVSNIEHFTHMAQNVYRTIRREVRSIRLYSTADGREHQISALASIVVVIMWAAAVMRRVVQKNIRKGVLLSGLVLIFWITIRLIKYQVSSDTMWDRFLWFSFPALQIILTFILLCMAWYTDRQDSGVSTPRWMMGLGAINLLFVVLLYTNDLHSFVYVIDLDKPTWRVDYGYGPGFALIQVLTYSQVVASMVIFAVKDFRNLDKRALFFPVVFVVLVIVYTQGYVRRVPLMWESDVTVVTSILTLLFFESSLRGGIIPANSKYIQVFTHSPLNIQIIDNGGDPALAPASAVPLDHKQVQRIMNKPGIPFFSGKHTLVYSNQIPGGYSVWQEDIEDINNLQKQIRTAIERQKAANKLLAEEERVRREAVEEHTKMRLMDQLEEEIKEKSTKLADMIEEMRVSEDGRGHLPKIAILLCYIKRRCNLFFRERETENLPEEELNLYINELAEFASHVGVRIATINNIDRAIPVRHATLIYDVLYEVVAWATDAESVYIINHLAIEGGHVDMKLLPSKDFSLRVISESIRSAIYNAGGTMFLKEFEEGTGIDLTFSNTQAGKRGEPNE